MARNVILHPPVAPKLGEGGSPFILAALLAVLTLAVYLPVRQHDYLRFDDADYVTDNGMVQSGLTWAGIKWAFTTGHASNWHPLTWLSHMLDAQWFGPGPAGPHLVNVLFHAANTVLLFVLLGRWTGARWAAAFVAALFALHPLHVESVAWVAERKDVLCAFFFLLTLWMYGRHAQKAVFRIQFPAIRDQKSVVGGDVATDHRSRITDHSSPRTSAPYWLALLFFTLSLLSKPMAVTLPFVLLLLDYWPLKRLAIGDWRLGLWPLAKEKAPFFLLSALSCIATFLAQQRGGAVRSLASFPVSERIGNALVAYAQYLGKLFWPVDLAIFYPHPGQWPVAQVALAAALVAGLSLLVVWRVRRLPFAAVGWFWFLGTLVPVIGLVQVSNQSMADRYTYLPYIGVFILIAWSARELGARRRGLMPVFGLAGCLAVITCAVATRSQLRHWRDGESLFRHALAVTERNFVAHNNLGNVLMDQGRVAEALSHYQSALEIQPKYADAWNNLGSALLEKNRVDEAIACYEKALALQPDYGLSHNNLGNALLRKGEVDQAIAQYQKTLALQPHYANAWNNLGAAWRQKGRADEAVVCFQHALKLNPNHARARNNLGDVLLQQGQLDKALAQFEQAIQIQPGLADAQHNLGLIRMQQGRPDEAAVHFRKVADLKPADAEARNNLGWCLLQAGRAEEAIGHFQKAVEIQPAFAEAQNNLGFALLQLGRARAAVTHLEAAANLQPDNAQTLSGLAWVLATCPDAAIRNGARAVELAERANQLAGGEPLVLRALAAAYAEDGRFPEALATAQRALRLTEAQSNAMLADMLRSEFKAYQAGSPFREGMRSETRNTTSRPGAERTREPE